jgi:hypothetical protein
MGFRFLTVFAALAIQCFAIGINVDTVFTSNGAGNPSSRFAIKNTSTTDTVYIDSVSIRKMSLPVACTEVGFEDSIKHKIYISEPRGNPNDTFSVSPLMTRLKIPPKDSLVFIRAMVGTCILCVNVQAGAYDDQCILKVTFIPNKGAKDSVVFIGPKITGGTKFPTRSNVPVSGKQSAAASIYDLSGRRIDKLAGMKHGVHIASHGLQGGSVKRVMVGE